MKFKILAISDIEILKKLNIEYSREQFKDIDFIVSAGDVSNDYLDFMVSILDKELIYVNGNHKYGTIHQIPFCLNMDGQLRKFRGLKILGLDGSMVYSRKAHQYSDRQMMFRVLAKLPKLIFFRPDLVITHAPPLGIHDVKSDVVHRGFKVYRQIIDILKPKLWIHGHIHLSNHLEKQESIVGETRVVNAYGYKIIEQEF